MDKGKPAGREALRKTLDYYYRKYNKPDFIESDPVSIPHLFSSRADIEISGFITATLSWGQRPVILSNARRFMNLMDDSPEAFVTGASAAELKRLNTFVHRTFNGTDARCFIYGLRNVCRLKGGMEGAFTEGLYQSNNSMAAAISHFRQLFFNGTDPGRTGKHVADPLSGAAAKRINMFLRWMVRRDVCGVDFGLWKSVSPALLMCPLDVHSGRVARSLGLLQRKQNDWKAVEELTAALRQFDAADPVKYDFALFGLGVNEKAG